MTMSSFLKLATANETRGIQRLVDDLSKVSEVRKVILFGSRVRGDFHGESDIDILVVLTNIRAKNSVIHILHEIEIEYDIPLSPVVFTVKEYSANKAMGSTFFKRIETEGNVLYDAYDRGKD